MQIFFLYESLVSAVFNNNDFYLIINEKLIEKTILSSLLELRVRMKNIIITISHLFL